MSDISNQIIDVFPSYFLITESISTVFLLLLTIITIPLYIFEILIIYRQRTSVFQGPFYSIIFIGMIFDVVSAINIFIGQILPARRVFEISYVRHENIIGMFFYTITYGGRCVQGATATLLSFNRVCAVCFPILYRKLNDRKYTVLMQIIQLSGFLVAIIFLVPGNYRYEFASDGYYSSFIDRNFRRKFYIIVAILEVFFVVSIVFFNITMIIGFRCKYNTNSSSRRSSRIVLNRKVIEDKQKQENNLTKMTFIVCTVEIIYFIFVVYTLVINQTINKRVFYFFYNILGVVYSTFSAWMLLIFSKPINTHFTRFFRKLKTPNNTQPQQKEHASTTNNGHRYSTAQNSIRT